MATSLITRACDQEAQLDEFITAQPYVMTSSTFILKYEQNLTGAFGSLQQGRDLNTSLG